MPNEPPRRSAAAGPLVPALLLAAALPLALACAEPEAERGSTGEDLVAEDGTVAWDRYYRYDEVAGILEDLSDRHPELTRLDTIGESFEGRTLYLMEVTNERTGPAEEKPGFYIDGGLHASELTGSAVALYTLVHLLREYGEDPEVTELLDRQVFYVRPKFNPDGSLLSLTEDQLLRSSVRPWDEDEDGELDEDPPQDLDGDGRILSMRIPDPAGPYRISGEDPRIMVEREDGDEGPFYRIRREGVDDDGDGRINEDGIGGLDLNRNFPRNWEREHVQPGAGPFPLSEPETYAAVEFVAEHPNITGIIHGHTSGGFVYRLPSASDPTQFDRTDIALIEELGSEYTDLTGRPVRPSSTDPVDHRYGTFISWGYWDQGVIGWVPEYSPGPEEWVPDYDGDGEVTEEEWHRLDDTELDGRYFQEWTGYDHPQLGTVEIGGWHRKFWGQNPPPEFLEAELEQQVPWFLHLAKQAPRIAVDEPVVDRLGDGRYRIRATVSNDGYLPTNLTERGYVGRETEDGGLEARVVRPPVAVLHVEGGSVVEGRPRIRVGHLAGSTPHSEAVTESSRTVSWIVRRDAADATVRVVARSDKGGTARAGPVELP